MSSGLRQTIPLAATVLGACVFFSGFLKLADPVQMFIVREPTDHIRLAIGLVVIIFSLILYRNLPSPSRGSHFPNFRGEWIYNVDTVDGHYSHHGDCVVKQDKGVLSIAGTRRHSRETHDGQVVEGNVNIHWSTTWCELCEDGKVRFDYGIDLADGHKIGYCIIDFPSTRVEEMSGNYYQLPTRRGDSNLVYGTISFRRKKPASRASTRTDLPAEPKARRQE